MSVSSSVLAGWYAQVGPFLEAGLSLERAVATTKGPPAALREQFRQRLLAGDSVEEALERGAAWLPGLDRKLISAGATSGRMPEMFKRLVTKHQEAVTARRLAIVSSLYPIFVAHFGVFAFPIKMAVLDGDLAGYAWTVLRILVPAWLIGGAFLWAVRRKFRPALAVLDALPLVAGHRRARALADLAFVLEAQVTAGISLDVAWLQAALAAGDPRLEPVAIKVADAVQRGEQVSTVINDRRELPSPFPEFWANGEATGRLDESLAHLHRHFASIASRKLTAAAFVYPKILFAIIAIWVAIQVIGFYAGYFRQYEQFM